MNTKLTIRPYARLLTMLGDQLIKNEQIAVLELIKNAYDADADWVKLSFVGFSPSGAALKDSKSKVQLLSKENKELKTKMKRITNSQNCYRLYNCKVTISPSLKRRKGKR